MSFRTTSHNQYLETGGITVYDNEEFNLVLTGVDLHRIKAIKFTTVVIIIITRPWPAYGRHGLAGLLGGDQSGRINSVSYTHLTLPTKRIV